jgi:hypothetical protein
VANLGAGPRPGLDEAFGDQHADRLAQGAAADAELDLQRRLVVKLLVGLEVAAQDAQRKLANHAGMAPRLGQPDSSRSHPYRRV